MCAGQNEFLPLLLWFVGCEPIKVLLVVVKACPTLPFFRIIFTIGHPIPSILPPHLTRNTCISFCPAHIHVYGKGVMRGGLNWNQLWNLADWIRFGNRVRFIFDCYCKYIITSMGCLAKKLPAIGLRSSSSWLLCLAYFSGFILETPVWNQVPTLKRPRITFRKSSIGYRKETS